MLTWILLGIALLVIEVLSVSFFMVFFGLGALTIAAILYFFVFPLPYQILGFSLLSCVYLACFRKLLKKRRKPFLIDSELIGAIALVKEDILPNAPGKILVGDTLWQATADRAILQGEKVKVLAHNNLTLEVKSL